MRSPKALSSAEVARLWRLIRYVLLAVACVTLAVLHAYEEVLDIKVDQVTVLLLLVASVPLLAEYVEVIKGKDFELRLRSRRFRDHVLDFLEDSARRVLWTFYDNRNGERSLGHSFQILVKDLLDEDRKRVVQTVSKWMESKDDTLVWLAAEIVGHFELEELREKLLSRFDLALVAADWRPGQLNALWAHSRFSQYAELKDFLLRTSSLPNQEWILFAFLQMEKVEEIDHSVLADVINEYAARERSEAHDEMLSRVLGKFPGASPLWTPLRGETRSLQPA